MSSEFDDSETAGRTDTVESPDGPRERTVGADQDGSRGDGSGAARQVSRTRVRVVTLEAEVELLEAERESLTGQVAALESEVAELEDEVAALELSLEQEELRRQRSTERYEHIIAQRNRAIQELRRELEARSSGSSSWPVSADDLPFSGAVALAKRLTERR